MEYLKSVEDSAGTGYAMICNDSDVFLLSDILGEKSHGDFVDNDKIKNFRWRRKGL